MKFVKVFRNIFFILIFSGSIVAQIEEKHSASTCTIAVVNSSLFEDEKQGIKMLIRVKSAAETNDNFGTSDLYERIDKLQKEIEALLIQNKFINEKYIELQKLTSEQKQARENSESNFHKRYSLLVAPINKRIRGKLDEFVRQKGYPLVIDKLETFIVVEGDTVDITSEFIQFCNEAFDKEKLQ